MSPLDHLDVDGSIECMRCGLDQAFESDGWSMPLAHAHDVGDLAGSAEGRQPHRSISIRRSNPLAEINAQKWSSAASNGNRMRLDCGPGAPTCARCHVALETSIDGVRTATRCPKCGDRATYDLPERAGQLCRGLVGIVADDNRSDQPQVQLQRAPGGGAIAILCASCSAPLQAAGSERIVTCRFCNTVCRIPSRAMVRSVGDAPAPHTWFLAFRGSSPMRERLEQGVAPVTPRPIEKPLELPAPFGLRFAIGLGVPLVVLAIVGAVVALID